MTKIENLFTQRTNITHIKRYKSEEWASIDIF